MENKKENSILKSRRECFCHNKEKDEELGKEKKVVNTIDFDFFSHYKVEYSENGNICPSII